jgi:hypothetical protein
MADVRKIVTFETNLEGNLAAGLEAGEKQAAKTEAALKTAAQAAKDLGAAVGDGGDKISRASDAWDRIAKKNDDVTAASLKLTAAQGELVRAQDAASRALQNNAADAETVQRVLESLSAKVVDAGAKLIDARAAADASTESQDRWNGEVTRGTSLVSALANETNAFTVAARAASEARKAGDASAYNDQLDRMRAKYDDVFAASKRYEAAYNEINMLQQAGGQYSAVAVQALDRLNASFAAGTEKVKENKENMDKVGGTAAGVAFALRDLSLQATDAFSSIATGQPVMTTLIQKATSVYNVTEDLGISFKKLAIAASDGVKGAVAAIGGWPVAAFAGIIAGFVAISYWAETSASKQGELRAQISATRDDFVQAAKDIERAAASASAATGATTAEATAAAQAIRSISSFSGSEQQLSALTQTAIGLAQALGTSIPDAAKKVAEAMQDPAKAVLAMVNSAEPLKTLDAATAGLILQMAKSGDQAGATTKLLEAMGSTAKTATEQHTGLQKALEHLSSTFVTLGSDGRSFADVLRSALVGDDGVLTDIVRGVDRAITAFENLRTKMPKGAAGTLPTVQGILTSNPMGNISGIVSAVEQYLGMGGSQNTAVSSAGALGIMQVKPTTGAMYQNPLTGQPLNLMNPSDNVSAGMQYIRDLQANGLDSQQAAGGYNMGFQGYKNNPAGAFNYQMKVNLADTSTLPTDTAGLIRYWGKVLGMSDNQIDLGMRIAVVENQGQQGALNASLPSIKASADAGGEKPAVSLEGAFAGPSLSMAGLNTAQGLSTQREEIEKLTQSITNMKIARIGAEQASNPALVAEYSQKIADQQVKLTALIDPVKQYGIAEANNAAITRTVGAADQALLRIRQENNDLLEKGSDKALTASQLQEKLADTAKSLAAGYDATMSSLDRSIAGTVAQTVALNDNSRASDDMRLHTEAVNETLKSVSSSAPDFTAKVDALTQKYIEQRDALGKLAIEKARPEFEANVKYLQTEISTLGMDNEQRALLLAHLQNENTVRAANKTLGEDAIQTLVNEKDQVSQLTLELQKQQSTLNYVSGLFESAFNTIGNAITQAFVSGQGAAVNWGNVVKAVISQVIQAFLTMAVVNPILNTLFGGGRTTLLDALAIGAIGGESGGVGGVGGGGGGGGLMSLLQLGATGSTLSGYNAASLFSTGAGGGGSAIGGINSLFSPTGLFGYAGAGANFLATPLIGSVSGEATNAALAGLGEGVYGPATPAAYAAAGGTTPLTVGGALGSLGGLAGGYYLGTTLGGLTAGGRTSGAQNAQIGAGVGALAGLAFGPVGSLIGGAAGGLIGGAFGPKNASSYSSTGVSLADGQIAVGQSSNQIAGSSRDSTVADAATINAFLKANGLQVTSIGTVRQIGSNTPGGFQDPSKVDSLAGAFGGFKFGATDPHVNTFLTANGGAGFGDMQTLATMIASVQSFVSAVSSTDFASRIDETLKGAEQLGSAGAQTYLASVGTFVSQTVPSLLKLGTSTGSLNDQVQALTAQFAPAISMAAQLGYKEKDLTDARDKAIATAQKAAFDALHQQDLGLQSRFLNAAAAVGDGGVTTQQASLFAFDANASNERLAFSKQLTDTFGDSYKSTQGFADQMAMLEQTLGEERLAIVKQYGTLITQASIDAAQAADVSLAGRFLTAAAAAGDGGVTTEQAALYNQDARAAAERVSFAKGLTDAFGTSYASTKQFADQMAMLERTLAEERLATVKQFNPSIIAATAAQMNAARQSVTGVISSISSYTDSLMTSNASALSPQDQLAYSRNQFNAVSGAAAAGDFKSLQQLTTYAGNFLNASRAVNGSGQGYADDFQKVVDALTSVAAAPSDALTMSALTASLQDQTTQLVDALDELGTKLDTINVQIRQNALAPARIAA